MYYVYEWFIIKTNEIIYVGKGTRNRYKVKKHNKFFNNMIRRYDCDSRIIKFFDNEEDAFKYEYERIKELKNINQCSCNIYEGGFGGTTDWWTKEKKELYSKNNCMKSIFQRERMSKNNPMKNPKIKQKMIDTNTKKVVLDGIIYDNVKVIANMYNKVTTTVYTWIKNGITNDHKEIYYLGSKPNKKVKKENNKNKKVLIDDIEFDSVKEASKHLNIDPSTLIKCLKNNKLCKNHKCKYANQQPSHKNSIK